MLSGISCRSTSESSADLKHEQTSQKLDTAVFGCDHGKSCEGIAGITAVESWEYTVLVEQVKSWEFFCLQCPEFAREQVWKNVPVPPLLRYFPRNTQQAGGSPQPPNPGLMQTQARQCLLPRHDSPQGQMVIAGTATWA